MALMCLQRLENAPQVGVTRTTIKDREQGRKLEIVEMEKSLLETERNIPREGGLDL